MLENRAHLASCRWRRVRKKGERKRTSKRRGVHISGTSLSWRTRAKQGERRGNLKGGEKTWGDRQRGLYLRQGPGGSSCLSPEARKRKMQGSFSRRQRRKRWKRQQKKKSKGRSGKEAGKVHGNGMCKKATRSNLGGGKLGRW